MGIFKRKPGGTFFGNLIRRTANQLSGGVLGNGAMMLDAQPATMQATAQRVQEVAAGVVVTDPIVKGIAVRAIWTKYKIWILSSIGLITAFVIYKKTRKPHFKKAYKY